MRGSTLTTTPYAEGLALLARREFSVAQLRERLHRKELDKDAVELALYRLQQEGALDDRRTAAVYARRAILVNCRGPRRVTQEIEATGIDKTIAHAVVSEFCAEVDADELLQRALNRRLNGPVQNRAQLRRLYKYLFRQGFEGSKIIDALRTHSNAETMLNE